MKNASQIAEINSKLLICIFLYGVSWFYIGFFFIGNSKKYRESEKYRECGYREKIPDNLFPILFGFPINAIPDTFSNPRFPYTLIPGTFTVPDNNI